MDVHLLEDWPITVCVNKVGWKENDIVIYGEQISTPLLAYGTYNSPVRKAYFLLLFRICRVMIYVHIV